MLSNLQEEIDEYLEKEKTGYSKYRLNLFLKYAIKKGKEISDYTIEDIIDFMSERDYNYTTRYSVNSILNSFFKAYGYKTFGIENNSVKSEVYLDDVYFSFQEAKKDIEYVRDENVYEEFQGKELDSKSTMRMSLFLFWYGLDREEARLLENKDVTFMGNDDERTCIIKTGGREIVIREKAVVDFMYQYKGADEYYVYRREMIQTLKYNNSIYFLRNQLMKTTESIPININNSIAKTKNEFNISYKKLRISGILDRLYKEKEEGKDVHFDNGFICYENEQLHKGLWLDYCIKRNSL